VDWVVCEDRGHESFWALDDLGCEGCSSLVLLSHHGGW